MKQECLFFALIVSLGALCAQEEMAAEQVVSQPVILSEEVAQEIQIAPAPEPETAPVAIQESAPSEPTMMSAIVQNSEPMLQEEKIDEVKLEEPVALVKDIKADAKKFVITVPEREGKMIEEIIETMGTSNVLALGFKKGHLKELGKQLKGLGPLQFLGYIFTHPKLLPQMRSIYKSSFKWKGFVEGIIPGLKRDASSEEFFEHLQGFATLLNLDFDALSEKAKKQDWEAFVYYILEKTT